MGKDTVLTVNRVSKNFKLPHEKHTGLKQVILNFHPGGKGFEVQHALHNVSFEVKRGEFFGIVGRNGSGKSTLLKILAGIYQPTHGSVTVNGKLIPFIELGVGFNPELTGRENVYLNGALLGFSRKETEAMYDSIVDFAELEPFMDQKLKNYSSGMQVRLAFSIAIRAQSDILLIDEVLAVGDANFQAKCLDVFRKLKKQGVTIVFVSHDMEAVREFCDRAVFIQDGRIQFVGSAREVAVRYAVDNLEDREQATGPVEDKPIRISSVELASPRNATFEHGQEISIRVNILSKKEEKVIVGASFIRADGVYVAGVNTKHDLGEVTLKKGANSFVCHVRPDQLTKAVYTVGGAVSTFEGFQLLDDSLAGPKIQIVDGTDYTDGAFNIGAKWERG